MKAHIVGGGSGGLAAAALLLRNADMSGPDITIHEADEKFGGGFFLAGDAKSSYNLPGSIFDREFRCALDLLGKIPTQAYSNVNVAEQFLTFNKEHPFVDQTHIVDRNLRRMHDQRYGLNLSDGLRLTKLSLTGEASLDGQLLRPTLPVNPRASDSLC
jgi:oleate hydratase